MTEELVGERVAIGVRVIGEHVLDSSYVLVEGVAVGCWCGCGIRRLDLDEGDGRFAPEQAVEGAVDEGVVADVALLGRVEEAAVGIELGAPSLVGTVEQLDGELIAVGIGVVGQHSGCWDPGQPEVVDKREVIGRRRRSGVDAEDTYETDEYDVPSKTW